MHLKLNLNGSVDPFVNYLKNFAKIRPSLLIEIDTNQKAFVAKTFSEDRAAVRFSAISFDACHMTVAEHDGEKELGQNRIKVGILIQLPKFIKMIERFGSDVDDKGNSNFDINVDYDLLKNSDGTADYVSTAISFKSNILQMKMDGFRLSELKYLSDEKFSKVFSVEDPMTFVLSPITIASIIKTSDIIKMDPRKDTLIFYVDGADVYVKDTSAKDKQANFVFKIGTLDGGKADYDFKVAIFREKFIQLMDKTDESFKVILGRRTIGENEYDVDRILFDSVDTSTKVVISRINEG